MRFATMTMPFAGALLLLGSAGAIRAQVISLNPLVTDEIAVVEPAILGDWDGLQITQAGDSEYEACFKGLCLRLRVTRLAGELFADFRVGRIPQADIDLSNSDALSFAVSSMHFFARIRVQGDDLLVELMDREWLGDQVKRQQYPAHGVLKNPDHGVEGNTVVLVAQSDEVKQFVLRYAWVSEAFSSAEVWHRHEPEPSDAKTVEDK